MGSALSPPHSTSSSHLNLELRWQLVLPGRGVQFRHLHSPGEDVPMPFQTRGQCYSPVRCPRMAFLDHRALTTVAMELVGSMAEMLWRRTTGAACMQELKSLVQMPR